MQATSSNVYGHLAEFLSNDKLEFSKGSEQWKYLEDNLGENVYSEMIYLLTQVEFEPADAKEHWDSIINHQADLSEKLNRNVGLRVALCDYFLNITPKLQDPVLVEIKLLQEKEKYILLDELTGVYNRRFFNMAITKELEKAERHGQPFSLLMLDVDKFKEYNDLLGHQAGDQALAQLADLLCQTARSIDHVVRYGGEEFVILLPMSDKQSAMIAAERYREAIEQHAFPGQEAMPSGNLTVTIGMASFPEDAPAAMELIQKADEALYLGKNTGRNRIKCAEDNRRLHPRIPVQTEVLFKMRQGDDELHFRPCSMNDLSLGGMLCRINQAVEAESPVEVIISGPDDSKLSIEAQIVRVDENPVGRHKYTMGLSFDLRSSVEEKSLRAIIGSYTSSPSGLVHSPS